MNLLGWLTKKEDPFSNIGNLDPVCPYCQYQLPKKPARKKQCPSCKEFIYVRTRPSDRQQVLVTDEQLDLLEIGLAITQNSTTYFDYRKAFDQARDQLSVSLSRPPTGTEIRLRILELLADAHRAQRDLGLYRCVRYETFEILKRQGKSQLALDILLEINYLDINGPVNRGAFPSSYPVFDPKQGIFAPGILNETATIASTLFHSKKQLEEAFLLVAKKLHFQLHLPIDPSIAWSKLKSKIRE